MNERNNLSVICFSKDRPFQLGQLLRSIIQFWKLNIQECDYTYYILYTTSNNKFDEAYNTLINQITEHHAQFVFVKEKQLSNSVHNTNVKNKEEKSKNGEKQHHSSFHGALKDILFNKIPKRYPSKNNKNSNLFVAFHVDDMIFYNNCDISSILNLLNVKSNHKIFSFFMKLHPNITYSHPSSGNAVKPIQFIPKQSGNGKNENKNENKNKNSDSDSNSNKKEYLLWMPSMCTSDWNYIFDFCGTVYCYSDVISIYNLCLTKYGIKKSLSSPNRFEVYGNNVISPIVYPGDGYANPMRLFTACMKSPVMSVITINKVQTDYKVPIYDKFEKTTQELLKCFDNNDQLDFTLYQQRCAKYNSVHIPDLFLMEPKEYKKKTKNEELCKDAENKQSNTNDVTYLWCQWVKACVTKSLQNT